MFNSNFNIYKYYKLKTKIWKRIPAKEHPARSIPASSAISGQSNNGTKASNQNLPTAKHLTNKFAILAENNLRPPTKNSSLLLVRPAEKNFLTL